MSETKRNEQQRSADEQAVKPGAEEAVQDLPEKTLGTDDAEQVKGGASRAFIKMEIEG